MSREEGKRGEDAACKMLRRNGYRILERNYRGPRYEVDIIASEGDIIAFVEVKTRAPGGEESAAASVGPPKQRRIFRAAEHYLMTHPDAQSAMCRFDVVLVEASGGRAPRGGRLIRDAFR
ncbi:YraN family protein [Nitrospinota bacterium]